MTGVGDQGDISAAGPPPSPRAPRRHAGEEGDPEPHGTPSQPERELTDGPGRRMLKPTLKINIRRGPSPPPAPRAFSRPRP